VQFALPDDELEQELGQQDECNGEREGLEGSQAKSVGSEGVELAKRNEGGEERSKSLRDWGYGVGQEDGKQKSLVRDAPSGSLPTNEVRPVFPVGTACAALPHTIPCNLLNITSSQQLICKLVCSRRVSA